MRTRLLLPVPVLVAFWLGGCALPPAPAERSARSDLQATGKLRAGPAGQADLPVLRTDSPPDAFIRYAVLNHPAVAAAYFDWRASVEAITPARALPDPQLTFQADITDTLMSFMPGLMFDLMGPGKRTAMAREATAGAEVARRDYVTAVLRVAAEARQAWVELAYVAEVDRLYASTIHTAEAALELTNADYATGRSMANLDQQIKLENLIAQHHAHHATIADRQMAARARFKAALGLTPAEPDPAWPQPRLTVTPVPGADELWRRAAANNAELAQLRALVEQTVAGVAVANQTGRPDFTAGAMVDLKASPLMVRPTASLSLPLWRDRIAATVAAAQARHDAAAARVNAAQLTLATELAQRLYQIREADRMLGYIDGTALPSYARTFSTLEAGVQAGTTSAAMIAETRLMALDLRHERLDWLRQRESAAVDLALLVADVAPADLTIAAVSSDTPSSAATP